MTTTGYIAVFRAREEVGVRKTARVAGLEGAQYVPPCGQFREHALLITTWDDEDAFRDGWRDFVAGTDPPPELWWDAPYRARHRRKPPLRRRAWPYVSGALALLVSLNVYVARYFELFGRPEVNVRSEPVDLVQGERSVASVEFMNVGRMPIHLQVTDAKAGLELLPAAWKQAVRTTSPSLKVGEAHMVSIPVTPGETGHTTLEVTAQVEGGTLQPSPVVRGYVAVRVWPRAAIRRGAAVAEGDKLGYCAFTLEVGVDYDEGRKLTAELTGRSEIDEMRITGARVEPEQRLKPAKEYLGVEWRTGPLKRFADYPFRVNLDSSQTDNDWRAICDELKPKLL